MCAKLKYRLVLDAETMILNAGTVTDTEPKWSLHPARAITVKKRAQAIVKKNPIVLS